MAQTEVKKELEVKKEKKITLLTPERTKHIEMALMRMKIAYADIKEALFEINEELLDPNLVETLISTMPTEEEVKIVHSFQGKREELGNPEKYCAEISEVPGFSHRLHALRFLRNFKEDYDELALKFDKMDKLSRGLIVDPTLLAILEYTLAVGNYLNGSSNRGGAYGFKLDTFDKIDSLRPTSGNPKRTLLVFIIENIEKNMKKDIINLDQDYGDYELASKTPISQLALDLNDLKKSIKSLQNAMKMQSDYKKDRVREFFTPSYQELNTKLLKLEEEINDLDKFYEKLCTMFCENFKTLPSDKFFEKFLKFWMSCRAAKQILLREKEIKRKEDEKKRRLEIKSQFNDKSVLPIGSSLAGMKKEKPSEIVQEVRDRRITKKSFIF